MTEHEHDPVESGKPSIGARDKPDALRPDTEDRPDRKLPPEQKKAGDTTDDSPDSPRPTESPADRGRPIRHRRAPSPPAR
jgi:hypothetical protein